MARDQVPLLRLDRSTAKALELEITTDEVNGCCARLTCPGARSWPTTTKPAGSKTQRSQELEALSRCSEWLQRGENVLLFGPSGVRPAGLGVQRPRWRRRTS